MKTQNGEHPLGDIGQLIAFGLFLVVWVGDSFFLRKSTFLSSNAPLFFRLVILGLALITAVCLLMSGHVVTRHEKRPSGVVSTGAFRYVRHPLYLASLLAYLGLTISTMSIGSFLLLAGIVAFHLDNFHRPPAYAEAASRRQARHEKAGARSTLRTLWLCGESKRFHALLNKSI